MTSRFRSNWTKERPNSSLPTFDSSACHNSHYPVNDDVRIPCYKDVRAGDDIANWENKDQAIFRNRYADDKNGKLCERDDIGASHGSDDHELDEDRKNLASRNYHRGSCRENFRYRGDIEVEHCRQRERRTPIEEKDTSSLAINSSTGRYDLAESGSDDTIHQLRHASSSLTTTTANGNSPISVQESNGSAKQVKRIEPRRDHHKTIGSLTCGERPVMEDSSIASTDFRSDDITDHRQIQAKDSSKENKRDRSAKISMRNERNEEFNLITEAVGCNNEIDDYESIDRPSGMKGLRDRSYSPVRGFATVSNGVSSDQRFERRTKNRRNDDRFYSPDRKFEENDFRCSDRTSRRHADGRSYSPIDGNNIRMLNGNRDISKKRSERLNKRDKGEELDSTSKRLGSGRLEERGFLYGYDDDVDMSREKNGSPKKYSNINEDSCQPGRGVSGTKNHTRHKALPEEFDVQIHRYERALRVSRKDSDLSRKISFEDHDCDLSRKNSFKDHHRPKDYNGSKNNNDKQWNLETTRRGSSEDRDNERGSRKNSFKSRYTDSTRKNSKTSRNLSDIRPVVDGMDTHNNNNRNNIINIHSRKNGSYHRDRTETVRRDHDLSTTTRKSSRCNDDEDEDDKDHDRSPWKNHRHSRALTPPKLVGLEDRDCSKERLSRISSSPSKERVSQNENDLAHNQEQNRNDCRGKSHDVTGLLSRGRDRFSSSMKRVVPTRSSSESCHDNFNARRAARLDTVGNKLASRDLVVDDEDQCDDRENLSFSTIERNGTTVIRIRTNSQSPVGQGDARSRRRTNYREVPSAARYHTSTRYEDEAEDEDEDDEVFERGNQRRDYRVGPRRLWSNQGGGVQITDLDEGQPCLHCGETCSGFSPHSWRKNCTSCKCPREAHDVCHEEWVSVRARLGLKGEGPNSYVGFDPRDRGLTWAPPGLSPSKVEEYFSMLPEISVPRIGTPGERQRDRQLATQLPKQDLARAYCRHLDSQHSASADDFMAARNEIALDIGSVKEILERGHKCGVCQELLKYGSLVVSASKLGLSYHPSCFQCTQCQELLVDLAYCVHDDALYCERHYAEQLKPRCAACDELIFSGEYTKAMNKDWHSGHFCCWQCDESLTGQRYVLRDEHPYCIKCYESVFANGCEECNKIIGIDSKDLSYKDKHWHEACFLCNKCRVSLVDKQFGSKVDKIYCGNCYDAQFASRCDGCGEIFRAGTKKMEYKTRQWHEKCFCCVVCKNPIGTKSFIPREQEIYCAGCYEDKFATRCVKCNKIITSGGVTYKNEPWHRDCFTCSNCNNSLAGQRFTSRDDKPYCAECFGELFAKRCTACTKPITGIGGTRFISFEDRHWHNNCFICAGCNTSLVGRGFITDGDDIICPECAKQKLSE